MEREKKGEPKRKRERQKERERDREGRDILLRVGFFLLFHFESLLISGRAEYMVREDRREGEREGEREKEREGEGTAGRSYAPNDSDC